MKNSQETKIIKKVLKNIKKRTNNFLKNIDDDLYCYYNDEFEYDITDEKIGITILENQEVEDYWRKFLANSYNLNSVNGKYDGFLFSLMHEVGHHFTYNSLSEWHHKIADFIKTILNHLYWIPFINPLRNYLYFHLKEEKIATDWGVKYILSNQSQCDNYWHDIKNYLQELTKICGDLK